MLAICDRCAQCGAKWSDHSWTTKPGLGVDCPPGWDGSKRKARP